MNELAIHPNVYATGPSTGLINLLEQAWVRRFEPGIGTLYIISGFANYNGGVRFYDTFRRHIDEGGQVIAIFGGSSSSRLTSVQVVEELLDAGVDVHLVNRKRLMHAKSYGRATDDGSLLIVTSGNFTGPGMSQNVEMSVLLDEAAVEEMNFNWDAMVQAMLSQKWDYYRPALAARDAPAWRLLYDEFAAGIVLDDTEQVTMVLRLSHADTARIMAEPGTNAGKGSQYFWLSKDSFGFLPPLTLLNRRGYKTTYSCDIEMEFVDLALTRSVRVTFEAENNLDFRLGTGPLRYTKLAKAGDLAAITRVAEGRYQLRIYALNTPIYDALLPHAVTLIGHQGKRYGYLANSEFTNLLETANGLGS
jgi:hypothetical protein